MAGGIIRNYLNIMNTFTQSVATIVCNIGNCLLTQILSQQQTSRQLKVFSNEDMVKMIH